jgi:hypothetical protein
MGTHFSGLSLKKWSPCRAALRGLLQAENPSRQFDFCVQRNLHQLEGRAGSTCKRTLQLAAGERELIGI